jgi:DNA-binding response OmpR family regulator
MIGETILVIDSDSETSQTISTTLEAEDYLVFTAPNRDIGITMAKKVNPSLIFINPAISGGLEICKTIHNIEQVKNVPIIVLSSFEGAMDQRYLALYGIVDSLKKPFSTEELISKAKSALSMQPSEFQPAEEEESDIGGIEEASGFGEETIQILREDVTKEVGLPEEAVAKEEDFGTFDETLQKDIGKIEKEKTEETTSIEKPISEPEKTYVMKKTIRRRGGMRNRFLIPIIAVIAVIVLGAGGFILYKKGLLPWIKPKSIEVAKPKPTPKAEPSKEQQKPQEVPAPAPKPEAKPETKPAPIPMLEVKSVLPGKVIYSVQIGAFKNTANAEALAKQYKEKGYEAFVLKGLKDKEPIYRVLIGKFANKKDADKMALDIRSKEKIKAIIFKE